MREVFRKYFTRGVFYHLATAVLATFFLLTIVEGLKIQLAEDNIQAGILYFVALISLLAAVLMYERGKALLERVQTGVQ